MAKSKGLLIDLDGTMYHGRYMIPGADALINHLKTKQIPYLFVTNNSTRTSEDVACLLNEMGIQAEAKDICTSSQATAVYIAQRDPAARVAIVGEDGLRQALIEAGLQIVEDNPRYVVQGIDRNFTYETLSSAVRWIRDGAKYIVTNPDLLLPSDHGLIPGAGTIAAAIEAGTGVKPVIIGKPSHHLMNYAIDILKLDRTEVTVIGDNMHTDISAGVAAGCSTILVLTGITTKESLASDIRLAGIEPSIVCKDLQELLQHL
ncbi:TIGR01457 family HAD-type hydrolase [Paenibacillus sp. CMAA1364]